MLSRAFEGKDLNISHAVVVKWLRFLRLVKHQNKDTEHDMQHDICIIICVTSHSHNNTYAQHFQIVLVMVTHVQATTYVLTVMLSQYCAFNNTKHDTKATSRSLVIIPFCLLTTRSHINHTPTPTPADDGNLTNPGRKKLNKSRTEGFPLQTPTDDDDDDVAHNDPQPTPTQWERITNREANGFGMLSTPRHPSYDFPVHTHGQTDTTARPRSLFIDRTRLLSRVFGWTTVTGRRCRRVVPETHDFRIYAAFTSIISD